MSDFIFNNSSIYKSTTDSIENQELYFTLLGMEDYIDQDNNPRIKNSNSTNIFAKKILRTNGTIKYMIKLSPNSKLANPVSIYGPEKDKVFLDKICRSNSKFKEVSNKVFDLYIKFLQSKNISWLNNAEREAE